MSVAVEKRLVAYSAVALIGGHFTLLQCATAVCVGALATVIDLWWRDR